MSPKVLAVVLDFITEPRYRKASAKRILRVSRPCQISPSWKYAVGLVIFNEVTNKDNVAEISKIAVRYQAKGLQNNCCQFIVDNKTSMDEKKMLELTNPCLEKGL